MTSARPTSGALALSHPEPTLDGRIEAAERDAIVMWRGQPIAFVDVPAHIALIDGRAARDGLYTGWIEAIEALNPLYRARFARWHDEVGADGTGDTEVARDLERLALASETVYHAALRRFLALIGIEQGDATVADLWHATRGTAWSQWFGEREVERAAADAGRDGSMPDATSGWLSAEAALAGRDEAPGAPAAAIGELYGSLVGDPTWLRDALHMAPDEVASYADFVAFVRLWRLRRALGHVQYEVRLHATDDPALQRAYFAGIVGHVTGISVPEAAYLRDVGMPFSSARELERSMLAGTISEAVERRFGDRWWADARARTLTDELARASSAEDVLAQLRYDALDWKPVVRQIRTRLIGEMSGYGGPNITTRAGTRKV